MKRLLTAILLLTAFALPTKRANAQTEDFGAWFGFNLEKEIKDWTFSVGEELRTTDAISDFYGSYTSLGIDYSPFKHLKFGTSYQFILYNDTEYDDIQPRHRLNFQTTGDLKWNNFKFSLRERLQMTFKDESERDYKMNPKTRWRNRLEVEYNIPKSKFTPAFSVESYYQLNNPDGNKFDGIRYKLTGAYKINKRNKLEVYAQYDNEINVKDPVDRTVLGIEYTLKLGKKKNKKEENE